LDASVAPALVLKDVEAGYGEGPVLRDFNLTVAAGEVYALLGPNGAGKSTAARVACGLIPVRRGRATAGEGAPRRGRIGLAPQDCALFPALTPRENVAAVAALCGLPRSNRPAAVERALALTGCAPRADEPVHSLSGGWRRRANLSAALVGRQTWLPGGWRHAWANGLNRQVRAAVSRVGGGDVSASQATPFPEASSASVKKPAWPWRTEKAGRPFAAQSYWKKNMRTPARVACWVISIWNFSVSPALGMPPSWKVISHPRRR
jgi:ABC-type transport system involved in cytochrome c biogenesis ATPase subunit